MKIAATLGALLVFFAQGAEFIHEHPARLGCAESHAVGVEPGCRASGGSLQAGRDRPEPAPAGEACLVCRWSRGPWVSPPSEAPLHRLSPPAPQAVIPAPLAPSSPALPGFLNRAPPRVG